MKSEDIIILKDITCKIFKNSVKSIYFVESQLNSSLSDLDILCFFDKFDPPNIRDLIKIFIYNISNIFKNRIIYIRYSTSSFFEPVSITDDKDPIVVDLLFIKIYKNTIYQLGFEAGIIVNLLRKGKLIFGTPIDPAIFENNSKEESLIALKHYFQHNISKLIELGCNFKSPYYVILNSIKILSLAIYKYLQFIRINSNKMMYEFPNKLNAFKDICHYLPNIEHHIKFIQKYFNINPVSLTFDDAQLVYNHCFLAVSKIFESFINTHTWDPV